MLRLRTFGSVFLAGESGEPLEGAAAQRRTLALLAVLAIAGEGGLSRDKLVGLLWPETDPERARHSLTQALYAARRALDADDLFRVNADIRLNRSRLVCDVNEFEAALDTGDPERAVALYAGPFLDGFFLGGSPEFEQWSSLHRSRLESRVIHALERLAETAEREGDMRRAVEWRKRLSAIRPLDSGNAVKLMTAMVEAGDRAGALQHARVHEVMLREQLELEPDPAVLALIRKLREPAPVEAGQGGDQEEPAGVAVLSLPPIPSPYLPVAAAGPRRLLQRRGLLAVGLVLAVLAMGVTIFWARRPDPLAAPIQLRQKVVVAPFRVAGATSALSYLRDGIVELLSTRLADDTAARAMDAGAVLGAWETAGFSRAAAVPRDSIVKLAGQLGVERVVVGSVVGTPSHLIIRASVLAVPSAEVNGEAIVEGPADSISALIDGLAAKLLLSQAGEDERLASYTTGSLPALRSYLAGQAAFRQDDYAAAIPLYQRALDLDPGFSLAALHLAMTTNRWDDDEQRRRGIALAWAAREALSQRDSAMLIAFAGPRYPLPSSASEQIGAWRRLIDLAPGDAESWYVLGERLFHDGATAGIVEAQSLASTVLERALFIDPAHRPARRLLLHLSTVHADSGALQRIPGDTSLAGSPYAPFLRWRLATARGDTADLRSIRGAFRKTDGFNLRAQAMASQFDGFGHPDGALALEILADRSLRRGDRVDLLLAQHSMLVQRGRLRAAAEAGARLAALQSGSHVHLRLRVLDHLYAEGDSAVAAEAAQQLTRLTTGVLTSGSFTAETRLADLCVLAQWRLARRDTLGMSGLIDALLRAPSMRNRPPVSATPVVCGELLGASLASLRNLGDATSRLEHLDSLAFTAEMAGDAIAYAPILIARLHEHLGHPRRAFLAIRKRAYMWGWPRYLTTALREEGRLSEVVGDRAGAREAYRRYLLFRRAPEKELLPEVEEVRRQLDLLK